MIGRRSGAVLVVLLVSAGLTIGIVMQLNLSPATDPPNEEPVVTVPIKTEGVFLVYDVNITRLNEFMSNRISGGPPRDGIPPIENPIYITGEEGDEFLSGSDIVFGLHFKNVTIAYPQRVLVWHEIVNDKIDGLPVSITYCPLTGSTIAFQGVIEGNGTTFGTSGKLINSNLVMYDRRTESYWPQILSQAVSLPSKGIGLQKIQMFFTNWSNWKSLHPDTLVLSRDTGYFRNYSSDPYGIYNDPNSYYHSGPPMFPVMHVDDRLDHKEVVVSLDINGTQIAIQKSTMRNRTVYNFEIGDQKYVVLYDAQLDVARSYISEVDGQQLTFHVQDGRILDNETLTEWNVNGTSSLGTMKPVPNMDVMWFAWVAYFPNTVLVCDSCS
ncbi:MAG: DUF3179 domain-containing protein [Candidatus Thorarchaeota archaeon]